MKHYDPNLKVLTAPLWLMDKFNGYKKGQNKIDIQIDPDGNPIIGTSILTDPTWDLSVEVNGKPLREWLVEIPYCYIEQPLAL